MKFPRTPFWYLVAHFVGRMFASEEEGGSGTISLGIGAVLALLASPGFLACLILLDKYASPWILVHHHRFDAYKLSVPDEYFFVVLSMTIMGLIMVLRWNRLLPDRRDFANLAPLPISSRDVFLANLLALLGLALVFAVVVNGVSLFLFPAVVTFADGSFSGYLRVALSHSVAVFSASLFSFFAVFALVGVSMLTVPKPIFRSVSVAARVLLIVVLLTEFFSNVFLQLLAGRLPSRPGAYMQLLPSFWFLGVYENIAGFARPGMAQLGHRALWALLAASLVSLAAYSLCYQRHYLRLAESLDLIGRTRHVSRLPVPLWLQRFLFRSRFEQACLSFSVKTLLRSERHVMFFGGYLGIGLVLVAQTFFDNLQPPGTSLPSASLLAVPILITFFLITGLRFAFDIPTTLNANWIFRAAILIPEPPLRSVARKLALCVTLPWQIFLLAPATAHLFGWRIALAHTAVVIALTILLTELLFAKFHSIPFTCSVEPDTQRFLTRILASLFAFWIAVPLLASLEHWILGRPLRFLPGALLLAIASLGLRAYKHGIMDADEVLTFEDRPSSAFELLKLA